MLVHIKLLDEVDEHMNYDYEKAKLIGHQKIEDIDKFVEFIHSLKKYEAPLFINNDWYIIEEYGLYFPTDSDSLLCFQIYVTLYC